MSILTGKVPGVSNFLNKCGLSCNYDGIYGTKSLEWWSTKRLILSVIDMHPEMTGLPGGKYGSLTLYVP